MSDICNKYKKLPPYETFADRCRYFQQGPELPEVIVEYEECCCEHCARHDEGWCLRLDHPDWKYNFVKIKEGMQCQKQI